MTSPDVSEIRVRVNYSETDQMGVVYHARYRSGSTSPAPNICASAA
jgi:hypothetical protein